MNRRQFLRVAGGAGVCSLSGCVDPPMAVPPGRIDLVGHKPIGRGASATFGHVSHDGQWGVVGGFPTDQSLMASVLFSLEDLDNPSEIHRLESVDRATRTNDVKFDAHREGIYYRTQETSDQESGESGFQSIDFGWGEGTPERPAVLGQFDTEHSGVHKLTTHPEEELLYLVDGHPDTDVGVLVVDVSSPASPELLHAVGPTGACHDLEYDPVRNVVHAAFIDGDAEGYVVYDAADPVHLEVIGHYRYAGRPEYSAIGEAGFEHCHQACPDPHRDLVIAADERFSGIPGGKHIFDIGWGDGSLTDPQPIGFTHAPDAQRMDSDQPLWWTTHFHDILYDDEEALLVDGGYRQGAWVCNYTDPETPVPTERFATTNRSVEDPVPQVSAWGAVYHDERDFVFVTDRNNGVFTFNVTAGDARDRGGGGPPGHYDSDQLLPDQFG